jgi:hypothetical protein
MIRISPASRRSERTIMRAFIPFLALIALPASVIAQTAPPTAAEALAATAGDWTGELQYRDYQSNSWQGLPMRVTIVAQPDGATTIRTAAFDDGPVTGVVTITTVSMVDTAAATITSAGFRKGRAAELLTDSIASFTPGADATRWTLVTTRTGTDGDGIADIRETATRDGRTMTTVKEVNPQGDGIEEWLPRNRTVLTRMP